MPIVMTIVRLWSAIKVSLSLSMTWAALPRGWGRRHRCRLYWRCGSGGRGSLHPTSGPGSDMWYTG